VSFKYVPNVMNILSVRKIWRECKIYSNHVTRHKFIIRPLTSILQITVSLSDTSRSSSMPKSPNGQDMMASRSNVSVSSNQSRLYSLFPASVRQTIKKVLDICTGKKCLQHKKYWHSLN
jgi:hypothetical protein